MLSLICITFVYGFQLNINKNLRKSLIRWSMRYSEIIGMVRPALALAWPWGWTDRPWGGTCGL